MSSLEDHQMYCEAENCPCQEPPKKGECLRDRKPTTGGNSFCSDYCAASYAQEQGITYIETEANYERE